jgi:hypothetical protein
MGRALYSEAFRPVEKALEVFGAARYLGAAPGRAALNDIAMYGMLGGFELLS